MQNVIVARVGMTVLWLLEAGLVAVLVFFGGAPLWFAALTLLLAAITVISADPKIFGCPAVLRRRTPEKQKLQTWALVGLAHLIIFNMLWSTILLRHAR